MAETDPLEGVATVPGAAPQQPPSPAQLFDAVAHPPAIAAPTAGIPPTVRMETKITAENVPASQVASVMPGAQPPRTFRPPQPRGFPAVSVRERDRGFREWLDQNAGRNEYTNYLLVVERYQPRTHTGPVIAFDERHPLCSMDELTTEIAEQFGGGSYHVKVTDGNTGENISAGRFAIDPHTKPPRWPNVEEKMSVAAKASEVDPDIAQKKKEIEMQRLEAQRLEEARRIEKAQKGDSDMDGRVMDKIEQALKDSQASQERMMTAMQGMLKEMFSGLKEIIASSVKPANSGESTLVAETMKSMQANQQQFMTTMLEVGKTQRQDMAEAAKAQAESSKAIMQMATDSMKEVAKGKGEESAKLLGVVMDVIGKQAAANPIKDMAAMRSQYREEMMDMMEFARNMGASPGGEEGGGGFLGQLGPIAQAIMMFLAQNRKPMPGIEAQFAGGKPLDQMTREELLHMSNQIAPYLHRAMQSAPVPAPQALPGPAAPAQPAQPQNPPLLSIVEEDDDDKDDVINVAATPAPQQPAQAPPAQSVAPSPVAPQAQPVRANTGFHSPAEALQTMGAIKYWEWVSMNILQIAVKDARESSPEPRWVTTVLPWVPEHIKKAIAGMTDESAVVSALKAPGIVSAWEEITRVSTPATYGVFMAGVRAMHAACKQAYPA